MRPRWPIVGIAPSNVAERSSVAVEQALSFAETGIRAADAVVVPSAIGAADAAAGTARAASAVRVRSIRAGRM